MFGFAPFCDTGCRYNFFPTVNFLELSSFIHYQQTTNIFLFCLLLIVLLEDYMVFHVGTFRVV